MNWGGFPVAFRFPVEDFSPETKRRCWSCVLPALAYADLTDSTLQEGESAEPHDPDQKIFIILAAPKSITPSRKNSLQWRRDGRLMSALALYQPVVQENYLELYAPTRVVAEVAPDRRILPREGFEGWLPERLEERRMPAFHQRVLVLPRGELPYKERDTLCRQAMRELYEADEGLYLKMLPLSPGGQGAVYTAAAFQHGRLFFDMIPDRAGEKHRCLFGVLPGRKLLIDGFSLADISAPVSEDHGLGRAIRVAKDRGFTDIRLCAAGLNPPLSEAGLLTDLEELYGLSRQLPLFDRVILAEYDADGQVKTESIDIDRRDKECVSSILSRRSGTAGN